MAHTFPRWLPAAVALAALAPMHAYAQRADENAVTAADDAFGTKVGSQSIGLYDSEHVRGFSPRAAGIGRTCLARLDAEDLNNSTDLEIMSSGVALPQQGRRLTLTVTADF